MARAFVVERETFSVMADQGDAAGMLVPKNPLVSRKRIGRRCFPYRRPKRILEERVLDVGQQQFLVLLLVRDAQFDQASMSGIVQQRRHGVIDMGAPITDLDDAWPREHSAPHALDALALRFVIGIEQERPAFVVQPIPGQLVAQQKGLEKPGGVRQVPLGG